ncbi:MAG: hypothetical protein LKJ88_03955 [Bacilli bacterium]|jgi:peptidoglycan/LPS O-acetylase OafA/YrhL|nr:hypothetical protein [Bacilli bacterium]
MKRVKIIKNIGVLAAALALLTLYLIFLPSPNFGIYRLPFIMFEFLLGSFSLYWSISKREQNGMINVGLIILGIVLALGFIITYAITTVSNIHGGVEVVSNVFYWLLVVASIGLLIYPLWVDFFADKFVKKAQ